MREYREEYPEPTLTTLLLSLVRATPGAPH
jgi:hypothetical protein